MTERRAFMEGFSAATTLNPIGGRPTEGLLLEIWLFGFGVGVAARVDAEEKLRVYLLRGRP